MFIQHLPEGSGYEKVVGLVGRKHLHVTDSPRSEARVAGMANNSGGVKTHWPIRWTERDKLIRPLNDKSSVQRTGEKGGMSLQPNQAQREHCDHSASTL